MTRRARLAVVVAAAVAALALLRIFDQHPVDLSRFAPADASREPSLPPRGAAGGALLVVSPEAVTRAHGDDASFAWIDILENEWGATRWIRPDEIATDAGDVTLAVVSKSAAGEVGEAGLERLASRALAVVVDAAGPDGDRRIGTTPVLTVDDLAGRVARRRQGLLGATQSIRKRFGRYSQVLEPEDLLDSESALVAEFPDADREIAALARRVDAATPIPRLARHPAGFDGTFVMTHDEDEQGGASTLALLRREASWSGRSTVFLVPSGRLWETWSDADIAEARRLGADLEIHWNRFAMPAGIWKIEPWKTVYRLSTQRRTLAERGIEALANRTHYLHLGADLSAFFRTLDAAGIAVDATFGPNRAGRGHLFGTARPFHPIDETGLPSPVLEVPFQTQEDWGGVDEAFLERLFRTSAEVDHCTLSAIVHPHLIVREEAGAKLHRRFFELASETHHWVATLADAIAFRRARVSTAVRIVRDGSGRAIAAEVDAPRDAPPFALVVPGRAPVPLSAGANRITL
jgi:hypothetical protein